MAANVVLDFGVERVKEKAELLCKAYLFGVDCNDVYYWSVYHDDYSNLVALVSLLDTVGRLFGLDSDLYIYIDNLYKKCKGRED